MKWFRRGNRRNYFHPPPPSRRVAHVLRDSRARVFCSLVGLSPKLETTWSLHKHLNFRSWKTYQFSLTLFHLFYNFWGWLSSTSLEKKDAVRQTNLNPVKNNFMSRVMQPRRTTLDKGDESGLCNRLVEPSSRRISAFVLAILLFIISKSALLVTGTVCGAKKGSSPATVKFTSYDWKAYFHYIRTERRFSCFSSL